MNFTYFKFLFINTVKRKSVWITWLLFLFTCTCFIIILPLAAKMNTLQVWANTTMSVCQTFMGMVASLFTAVLAINVFKDSNEEGTELIVISKPISRIKIVITKFLLFGFFCLLVNLTTVFLSIFTICLPRTEIQFYFGLLVSMFIGNCVTFAVFGSISVLLTIKFAKAGVVVTNVIISLVFLVYQTLTLFVFKTPSIILDDNKMSASSYIIHQRNMETGAYSENEVVKFEPAEIAPDKEHPCQATNWHEMKQFWEESILSKDVTPVLNVTDLAGQIALTYLSYNTNKYAQRQANRMFALSRFYNYQLTAPASPEINDSSVPSRPEFNWIYTDWTTIKISEDDSLSIPTAFGFEGIKPLTGTRLRGFTNQIPIGSVRSKEILSAKDVYLEREDWNKYNDAFENMYISVFDYKNGHYDIKDMDAADYPIAFSQGSNLTKYYSYVHEYLTNNKSVFNINTIDDLNNRFIQFKNYCYWKALEEQIDTLSNVSTAEKDYYDFAVNKIKNYSQTLGFDVSNWYIKDNNTSDTPLLEQNTAIPSINLLQWSKQRAKEQLSPTDYQSYAPYCAYAQFQKAAKIFNNVCFANETYLYDSLDNDSRSAAHSGSAFMVKDNWYPYLNGILGQIIPINLPLGQNMQYFFYETQPTLHYWMFAVIWGLISLSLFAAGAVVYYKYDVK